MYSILTTVFLYVLFFCVFTIIIKIYMYKKKKNKDETGLSALAC